MQNFYATLSTKLLKLLCYLCILSSSSCYNHEGMEDLEAHPLWSHLNEKEDNLPQDQCKITKLGLERLRFHTSPNQKYLNQGTSPVDASGFVTIDSKTSVDWILTPHFYGELTEDAFPKTKATGIKCCRSNHTDKMTGGMPEAFLEELLSIEKDNTYKDCIIILSKGMEGKLGVSTALKDALKRKKDNKEILDYHIQSSRLAAKTYNEHVKAGKKVFLFIHTID